jgi:hypothetical protein
MKPDVLSPPALPYEVASRPLVRTSTVRQLVARAWWVACLLPALVLLAVAVGG